MLNFGPLQTEPGGTKDDFVAKGVLLLIALYLIVDIGVGQFRVATVNGLWLDELFSLVYSNPNLTFQDVTPGIIRDTTPPLHMYSLWLIRHAVTDLRGSFLILNLLAGVIAFLAALRYSRSLGMPWVMAMFGVFLASGEAQYFLQEGRPYFLACSVVMAGTVLSLDRLIGAPGRPSPLLFAIVGFLAAMSHLYASIVLAGLAFSLCAAGLLFKRRDLLIDGFVLGFVTSVASVGWSAWAMTFADRVRWLTFDLSVLKNTLSMWGLITFGSFLSAGLVLAGYAAATFWKPTRPVALAIGVALGLFFGLPILVSLVQPIIASRYFLIGSPLVGAGLVLFVRAAATSRTMAGRSVLVLCALGLAVTTWYGPSAAVRMSGEKQIWRGSAMVAREAAGCPAQSLRVGHPPGETNFLDRYALASGLARSTFIDTETAPAESLSGSIPNCPIAGWYEHAKDDAGRFLAQPETPDTVLLSVLGLDGDPSGYEVIRHGTGYVVRRKDVD